MRAMPWSEEKLLRWLAGRARPSRTRQVGSRGHDAAVLRRSAGRPVVCTDQCVEGVHFETGVAPRRIGAKAVARTLSDLAATAARPSGVLLALSAPARAREAWLRAVIEGADACARRHGAELVGGDLACVPGPAHLSVSAFGELAGKRRPPGRDRARPGQLLLATGSFGGSGRGRHLDIEPRLAEGVWLHEHGATALMDVSDGLSLDLERLARLSRVRVDLERVPIHPDAEKAARTSGRPALEHALEDGEDHELVATMTPAAWKRCERSARRRFPALEVVGCVRAGEGLRVGGRRRKGGGWVHGS